MAVERRGPKRRESHAASCVEAARSDGRERQRKQQEVPGPEDRRRKRQGAGKRVVVGHEKHRGRREPPEARLPIPATRPESQGNEQQQHDRDGGRGFDDVGAGNAWQHEPQQVAPREHERVAALAQARRAQTEVLREGQQNRGGHPRSQGRAGRRGDPAPRARPRRPDDTRGQQGNLELQLGVPARENEERRDGDAGDGAARRLPRGPAGEQEEQRRRSHTERQRVLEPGDEGAREREDDGAEGGCRPRAAEIPKESERRTGREQETQQEREVPARAHARDQDGPLERRGQSRLRVAEQRHPAVLMRVPERDPPGRELAPRQAEPRHELPHGIGKRRRLDAFRGEQRRPRVPGRLDVAREQQPPVHSEGEEDDQAEAGQCRRREQPRAARRSIGSRRRPPPRCP